MVDTATPPDGEARFRREVDQVGPLSVGALATFPPPAPDAPPGQLMVFGDSDFATNFYLNLLGNRDLILSAVAVLAEDPALIAVRRKGLPSGTLSPISLTDGAEPRRSSGRRCSLLPAAVPAARRPSSACAACASAEGVDVGWRGTLVLAVALLAAALYLYRDIDAEHPDASLAGAVRGAARRRRRASRSRTCSSFDPADGDRAARAPRRPGSGRCSARPTAGRASSAPPTSTTSSRTCRISPRSCRSRWPPTSSPITASIRPQGVVELERSGAPPLVLLHRAAQPARHRRLRAARTRRPGRAHRRAAAVGARQGDARVRASCGSSDDDRRTRTRSPARCRVLPPPPPVVSSTTLPSGSRTQSWSSPGSSISRPAAASSRRASSRSSTCDGEVRPARIDRHAHRLALDEMQLAGADAVPDARHAEVGPLDRLAGRAGARRTAASASTSATLIDVWWSWIGFMRPPARGLAACAASRR